MNDEEKDKGKELPWVFRRAPVPVDQLRAGLDRGGAVYRLFANTRNPYLKRVIAAPPAALAHASRDVQALFRWLEDERHYRVAPPNSERPYRRRGVDASKASPPPEPKFQEPSALPGGALRLPAMIGGYFQTVLARLKEDPDAFFDVIEEMVPLLHRNKIKIRVPDAFRAFEDWAHLMETLQEIARYPAPETFDLFCGALLAYRELVEPA